jgi:hypothetical protein
LARQRRGDDTLAAKKNAIIVEILEFLVALAGDEGMPTREISALPGALWNPRWGTFAIASRPGVATAKRRSYPWLVGTTPSAYRVRGAQSASHARSAVSRRLDVYFASIKGYQRGFSLGFSRGIRLGISLGQFPMT